MPVATARPILAVITMPRMTHHSLAEALRLLDRSRFHGDWDTIDGLDLLLGHLRLMEVTEAASVC